MNNVEKIRANIAKWGQWAALRNAFKNGLPFEDAYEAVFGRKPRIA